MKWSFESKTECTAEDRALEHAINLRLTRTLGTVSCYRDSDGFGLIYSYNGLNKELRRDRFIADVDYWIAGLETTRQQMLNRLLPQGWVYDIEDADADPIQDAAEEVMVKSVVKPFG